MLAAALVYSIARYFGSKKSDYTLEEDGPGLRTVVIPLKALSVGLRDESRPLGGPQNDVHMDSHGSFSDVAPDSGADSLCLGSKSCSGSTTPSSGSSGASSPVHSRYWHCGPHRCLAGPSKADHASEAEEERDRGRQGEGSGVQEAWALQDVVAALSTKLAIALKLLGNRDEVLAQLQSELEQVKAMYRQDVESLTRRLAAVVTGEAPPSSMHAATARAHDLNTLLTYVV